MQALLLILMCLIGLTISTPEELVLDLAHISKNDAPTTLAQYFFADQSWTSRHLVTEINLQSNTIVNIEAGLFANFPNLITLNLSDNMLRSIDIEANQLRHLNLSSNNLTTGDFATFPSLGTLSVASNKFEKVNWTFEELPIADIDLSDNVLLKSVHIQAENLQFLGLRRVQLDVLRLNAPKLKTLDLRHSKVHVFLGEDMFNGVCHTNVNREFVIVYVNENFDTKYYNCTQLSDSFKVLSKVPQTTKKPIRCDLSTLRINVGDVVLSQKDFFRIEMSFYGLVGLIVVLSVGNFTVLYLYLQKAKSLRRRYRQ